MAALTPQIDTADASSARSLSSSLRTPPSHQVKPNTIDISSSAWMIAGPAAVTSTFRLIEAPSSTRPVLMKNSVRNPRDNASRSASLDSTALPMQAQRDCINREFDGFGDAFERRSVRPLRDLGLEEPRDGAEGDDDEHARDGVADA